MKCDTCGVESDNQIGFLVYKKATLCYTCWQYKRFEGGSKAARDLLFGLITASIFLLNKDAPWFYANLFLFSVMAYVSVIPHELGHAVAAWLLRFEVIEISIGRGKRLFSGRFKSTYYEFRLIPLEGYVRFVTHRHHKFFKIRQIISFAAGPLTNLMLFWTTWFHFADMISEERFFRAPAPLTVFAAANLITGILNLIPFKTLTQLGRGWSDGGTIVALLFRRGDMFQLFKDEYFAVKATTAFKYSDYSSAKRFALDGLERKPQDLRLTLILSAALVGLKEYKEAVCLMEEAMLRTYEDENLRALMKNNLAFVYLLLDEPELIKPAKTLVDEAMQTLPWSLSVRSTKGAVDIASGNVDEGMRLLLDPRFTMEKKANRAIQACSLAIGYALTCDLKSANRQWMLAKSLDPDCVLIGIAKRKIEQLTAEREATP